MKSIFRVFADWTAEVTGSPWVFFAVVVVTAMWLAAGPGFHFSDTWQLTMNTFASQVTFLIAFLLQKATFPAGEAALPADSAALKAIKFVAPK